MSNTFLYVVYLMFSLTCFINHQRDGSWLCASIDGEAGALAPFRKKSDFQSERLIWFGV